MQQLIEFAKAVLIAFTAYAARYWPLVAVLILLHLAYLVWVLSRRERDGEVRDSEPTDVLEHFFRRGYEVERVIFQGRMIGEYILTRLGARTIVHVKWWSKAIGDKPVTALYNAQSMYNCEFGILISKEGFTRSARQAAVRTEVWLWDYVKLEDELKRLPTGMSEVIKTAAPAKNR